MWHLDTNIVVAYLRGDRRVAERLAAHLPDVAIDTIVLAELLYGVRLSAREAENMRHLSAFLSLVEVASFDESCAEACAQIRARLHKQGRLTSEVDHWIAAACLARGATMVTDNVRHFASIEGLEVEDWLA